jgi:hypothetical protein
MKTFLAILVAIVIGRSDAVKYSDSIDNPANIEFVREIAFNEGIDVSEVTQQMFNERYL